MRAETSSGDTATQPSGRAVAVAMVVLHMAAERERVPTALRAAAEAVGAAGARIWWRARAELPITHWGTWPQTPAPAPMLPGQYEDFASIWAGERYAGPFRTEQLPAGVLPAEAAGAWSEAWALIPSGARARGVVLFWWTEENEPAAADRELLREALSAFASQVWWRERWAQRKLERELLDETARLLAQSFDQAEVMGRIFELLRRVVHYDAGGIFLIQQEAGEVAQIVQTGYESSAIGHLHLKIGQGLVGHVAKTGELVNVPDVSRDPRYFNARPSTRSTLVVPVEIRERRIGVLNLESDRSAAYSSNDEWLVESFARQVAIALERAELFAAEVQTRKLTEQLAVARSIQESFLPQKPPAVEGYDIAGVNFPSEQVGGDYFDFVPIVEGQWGIAIADVSGKGIPAALIMAGFRASLISEIRNNYAIRTVFRKVNVVLREMTAADNFVTAFYGVLDARNRVFTFCNAGHNPPLLLRATGEVERLREGGPLVGVIRDAQYEERPVWLGTGDLLLLYTDGVTETARPSGEEFGEDRLLACVRSTPDVSAAELCQRIREAAGEFAGGQMRADDITLIIIKVR